MQSCRVNCVLDSTRTKIRGDLETPFLSLSLRVFYSSSDWLIPQSALSGGAFGEWSAPLISLTSEKAINNEKGLNFATAPLFISNNQYAFERKVGCRKKDREEIRFTVERNFSRFR